MAGSDRSVNQLELYLFRLLSQILATDDGRRLLADSLNGVNQARPLTFALSLVDERIYPDLNPAAACRTKGSSSSLPHRTFQKRLYAALESVQKCS